MGDPLAFVLAVLSLLATPGPTNTLLATAGALMGWRRAVPLLAGELGGYLVAIAAIHLVLAPVLAAYPVLGTGLKLLVALYLVFVAIKLWRRPDGWTMDRPVTVPGVFWVTLLNPKALVFALAIIPFDADPTWPYLLGFAALVPGVGLGWVLAGALIGRAAGQGRFLPRAAAGVLTLFAGLVVASIFH